MENKYSYMDNFTDNEIANFKEEGQEIPLNNLELKFNRLVSKTKVPGIQPNLVSEGDSWFDYLPGTDLIDCLRMHHGYYIKNYARAGDTLENMIYGTGINRSFQRITPSIDKVLRKIGQMKPKVFLFSGGGNDISGDEFPSYLNHNNSGLPVLRDDYINNMINIVFKKYFEDLIAKVSAISPDTNILVHGYGHTIPTGKGVGIFSFNFAGPWLRPALAMKGIFVLPHKKKLLRE